MRKKIAVLSVLLAGLYAAQTAGGVPYTGSTYYSFSAPETDKVLSGRIDFGVFDREIDNFIFTPPGEGQYIYVYQIWNDEGAVQEAVGYFAVLLGGTTVDGIGADSIEGDPLAVEPTDTYFDQVGDAVFLFKSDPEEGSLLGDDILEAGLHSYALIFTSDSDWMAGEYEISGGGLGSYETPPPVPEPNPEPATMLIFGVGAGITLVMKRKSL